MISFAGGEGEGYSIRFNNNSYYFKCLRGDLTKEEIGVLLSGLLEGKITFAEFKVEASRIKEMKEVQRQFISSTGSKNWLLRGQLTLSVKRLIYTKSSTLSGSYRAPYLPKSYAQTGL